MVKDPWVELLCWFRVLQTFAKLGMLPKRLSTVMVPKCAACIDGAAYKQPWQMQSQARHVCIFLITSPAHLFPLTK